MMLVSANIRHIDIYYSRVKIWIELANIEWINPCQFPNFSF